MSNVGSDEQQLWERWEASDSASDLASGDADNESVSAIVNDFRGVAGGVGLFAMEDCDVKDWYSGGTTILYLMYITVFCVALVGNMLVIYVVIASPRMRTTTNYWLVNLAVGDGLMTIACIPFSFVSTFRLQYWPFGTWMCLIVNFSQAVSVLVSAYTLVAISADRYIAIIHPLRPRLSSGQVCIVLAVVWAFAALCALPILLRSALTQPSDHHKQCDRYICSEQWDTRRNKYAYSMILMTLQYILPLFVLLFTYTRIALIVWGKRTPGEANNIRDKKRAVAKRKMIKMMVTVVLVFTICWLPFNTLLLVLDNDEEAHNWKPLPYVYVACHWLAMSHSCANPLIYCWMNSRFRQAFLAVLSRFRCARHLLPRSVIIARTNTLTTFVSMRHTTKSRRASPASAASTSAPASPEQMII